MLLLPQSISGFGRCTMGLFVIPAEADIHMVFSGSPQSLSPQALGGEHAGMTYASILGQPLGA
jgi:hypothetical protein